MDAVFTCNQSGVNVEVDPDVDTIELAKELIF